MRESPYIKEIKESRTGKGIYLSTMGRPAWTPRNYADLAKESYEMNAVSFRCVKLIADGAARIVFRVREKNELLDEHPALKLLNFPNKFHSRFELLTNIYSTMLLAGQAYVEAVSLDDGPEELYSLRPDRMRVVPGPKGYPSAYIYTVNTKEFKYEIPDLVEQLPILHIKDYHPTNDHYGLSPIESAAYSIDIHNQTSIFLKSLLENSAKPSGALVYKGTEGNESLGTEQFTRLKNEIEEKYSGPKNAGRPLLLDGGLEWVPMSMTPHDLQFSDLKTQSARDIALAFGVPPQLLGIPGDNTYTNYSQAVRALYRQTIIPLVQHICQDFTVFLQPSFPGISIEPVLEDLEALSDERKELWTMVNQNENLTTNEKRHAMGYAPYDEKESNEVGDVIYSPVNKRPLGEEPPEAQPKPEEKPDADTGN